VLISSRLATTNEEQRHDAKLRETSLASLVVVLFMVLMTGMAVLAVINLWPLYQAVPVSPPATSQE
jgi:type IV secretory pathway component VirB8